MTEKYKDFLKKDFFDEKYSIAYDKWVEDPFSAFLERGQNRGFLELTEIKPGFKVLDIGAGTGKYELIASQLMKGSGFIVAVDFSKTMQQKMIKNLKEKKPETKVFLVRADAEELPFKKNSFDEVFSINTFQYLPNAKTFFKEVNRVLRKRGNFVVDSSCITELRLGYNLMLVSDRVRKFFGKKPLSIYKQYHTHSSIAKKLRECDFKVEKTIGVNFVLPWITREHVGITLPSPQHLIIFFPKLFRLMEAVEKGIRNFPILKSLCGKIYAKATKN